MSKKNNVFHRFQITKRNSSLVFFLLLLSVISIVIFGTSSAPPPIEFDQANLNQQITLDAVPEMNTFKTGDTIFLFVSCNAENRNAEVVFPNNFNRRIFIKDGRDWGEVFNRQTTYLYDNVILNRAKCRDGVILNPKLPDLKKSYYMRLYIFGDMTTDEETIQVAAYTDFMLRP
jgi:hypothetical protein